MKTAKSLGFSKGDLVHTGLFPGIIIGHANTGTPLCEVWGVEQELGSVYAEDLSRLSWPNFLVELASLGYTKASGFSPEAKAVIASHQVALNA